jgi:hypothetical protein
MRHCSSATYKSVPDKGVLRRRYQLGNSYRQRDLAEAAAAAPPLAHRPTTNLSLK